MNIVAAVLLTSAFAVHGELTSAEEDSKVDFFKVSEELPDSNNSTNSTDYEIEDYEDDLENDKNVTSGPSEQETEYPKSDRRFFKPETPIRYYSLHTHFDSNEQEEPEINTSKHLFKLNTKDTTTENTIKEQRQDQGFQIEQAPLLVSLAGNCAKTNRLLQLLLKQKTIQEEVTPSDLSPTSEKQNLSEMILNVLQAKKHLEIDIPPPENQEVTKFNLFEIPDFTTLNLGNGETQNSKENKNLEDYILNLIKLLQLTNQSPDVQRRILYNLATLPNPISNLDILLNVLTNRPTMLNQSPNQTSDLDILLQLQDAQNLNENKFLNTPTPPTPISYPDILLPSFNPPTTLNTPTTPPNPISNLDILLQLLSQSPDAQNLNEKNNLNTPTPPTPISYPDVLLPSFNPPTTLNTPTTPPNSISNLDILLQLLNQSPDAQYQNGYQFLNTATPPTPISNLDILLQSLNYPPTTQTLTQNQISNTPTTPPNPIPNQEILFQLPNHLPAGQHETQNQISNTSTIPPNPISYQGILSQLLNRPPAEQIQTQNQISNTPTTPPNLDILLQLLNPPAAQIQTQNQISNNPGTSPNPTSNLDILLQSLNHPPTTQTQTQNQISNTPTIPPNLDILLQLLNPPAAQIQTQNQISNNPETPPNPTSNLDILLQSLNHPPTTQTQTQNQISNNPETPPNPTSNLDILLQSLYHPPTTQIQTQNQISNTPTTPPNLDILLQLLNPPAAQIQPQNQISNNPETPPNPTSNLDILLQSLNYPPTTQIQPQNQISNNPETPPNPTSNLDILLQSLNYPPTTQTQTQNQISNERTPPPTPTSNLDILLQSLNLPPTTQSQGQNQITNVGVIETILPNPTSNLDLLLQLINNSPNPQSQNHIIQNLQGETVQNLPLNISSSQSGINILLESLQQRQKQVSHFPLNPSFATNDRDITPNQVTQWLLNGQPNAVDPNLISIQLLNGQKNQITNPQPHQQEPSLLVQSTNPAQLQNNNLQNPNNHVNSNQLHNVQVSLLLPNRPNVLETSQTQENPNSIQTNHVILNLPWPDQGTIMQQPIPSHLSSSKYIQSLKSFDAGVAEISRHFTEDVLNGNGGSNLIYVILVGVVDALAKHVANVNRMDLYDTNYMELAKDISVEVATDIPATVEELACVFEHFNSSIQRLRSIVGSGLLNRLCTILPDSCDNFVNYVIGLSGDDSLQTEGDLLLLLGESSLTFLNTFAAYFDASPREIAEVILSPSGKDTLRELVVKNAAAQSLMFPNGRAKCSRAQNAAQQANNVLPNSVTQNLSSRIVLPGLGQHFEPYTFY